MGSEMCIRDRFSLHNYVIALQTPLSELKLPLSIKWRKRNDMPFSMGYYPQVVIVKGKVYTGGGWASLEREKQTVMVCDPQRDVWHSLPPYMYAYFTMATVNDQLVLVGGRDVTTHKSSAMLGVWSEQSQTWTNPFPPMPTPRRSPSVVTHDNRWLVVVGGKIEDCLLYTSPSPRDATLSRMPSSA